MKELIQNYDEDLKCGIGTLFKFPGDDPEYRLTLTQEQYIGPMNLPNMKSETISLTTRELFMQDEFRMAVNRQSIIRLGPKLSPQKWDVKIKDWIENRHEFGGAA